MTSKLTREERLQALYDLKVGQVLSLADIENVKMLSRMALAAIDSEPVAVIDKEGNPMTRDECNDDRVFAICCKVGTPLHTHPAPSIPSAVTWCPKCNDTGLADSGGVQPWGEPILIECDCRTEPAPVVPEEITSASAPEVFEIAAEAERLGLRGTYASYAVGWNACRAAMLNGGKS